VITQQAKTRDRRATPGGDNELIIGNFDMIQAIVKHSPPGLPKALLLAHENF
jgi:hypothetical protein